MKRIIKNLLCIVVLLFTGATALKAQDITVQGKVTDKKVGLQGVTVAEVDAENRTVRATATNVDGEFALRISNKKNKLNFSLIGYKTLNLSINDRATFNISLESNARDLGEVVIMSNRKTDNGMVAIAEKNSTMAASRIDAKVMEEMQAASIDQALQGRIAGVDITAASGDPGAGMQIRIRGTSSINGANDPLIVVDGMPYETQIPADFNFGTADENGYASLLNIAPADIKEITILKDAAATAIWGSRAANGVLVIVTKRGAVGKPVITYTFKGSRTKQPEAIPYLNGDQYSTLIPEEYMNRTGTPLNTQTVKEFQYDPKDPYWYNNYSNNTDWIKAITRVGITQDHNVSMQGGGERARYFASLSYLNQKGTTIGTDLNRIGTRINLDYQVSDRIRFRSDLSFSHTDNNRNFATNIRDVSYVKMPNMSIYEYDDFGNLTPNYFSPASNVQGSYAGTYNPVALASAASYKILTDRVTPHFNLTYDIAKNVLQTTFDIQFDINNIKTKTFLPQVATGRPATESVVNRAYDGDADIFNVTTKTNFVYTPRFTNEKHSLISFLTIQTTDNKYVSQEAQTTNSAASVLQDPSIPARTTNADSRLGSSITQTRNIAATLSGNYGYLERYFFTAAVRGEGHSRFGPAHRYGLFPTVSGRYRISGEPFMQKFAKKFLDELSIRLSYGLTPNAPRKDYSFYNTYAVSNSYLGQAGVYPANMELRDLSWETIVSQNLGFNLGMFKNRLIVDADFYKKRTKNLFFYGLQISSFTGFNSVDMNVGIMDNNGWELNINTTPFRTKRWTVDFNFNIAQNQNMIKEISPYYPTDKGNITSNGQYKTYMQVNNPFGSFYGFRFKGVYTDKEATIARDEAGKPIIGPTGEIKYMQFNYPTAGYVFQPGDAMYEDVNHDGNINYMDVVYLGNGNPKFTGGFGPSISYKGGLLKLSAFFNFRQGVDVVNGTKMTSTNMYGYNNQSTAVLRRWKKEGDETDMPRALYGAGYNWLGSDRYVEDASFLRFRTLTLRYTLPKSVAGRLKVKNISAYATVENLFTWTKYTGQDPEVSSRGADPFRVAIDYSSTPPVKQFTFGVTGSF